MAVPFSSGQSTTKVALVKETKHKANPATDETVKLYSKAITPREELHAPVKRLTLSLEKH